MLTLTRSNIPESIAKGRSKRSSSLVLSSARAATIEGLEARQLFAATPTMLNFEGLASNAIVTTQFASHGVTFNNATILTQAHSLNSVYPPHSGVNVVYNAPGAVMGATAKTGSTWSFVSAYVTGNEAIVATAYAADGSVVGSARTSGANYIGKGTPNALLKITATGAKQIASVKFVGSRSNTFTVDDFSFLSKPGIEFVTAPDAKHNFYITSAPAMPTITLKLSSLPDGVSASTLVSWNASVSYTFSGHTIGTTLPVVKLAASGQYTLTFPTGTIIGGNLKVTATMAATGGTTTLSLADNTDTKDVKIVGKNPDLATIAAYVTSKGTPSAATGASPTFAAVVKKIIAHESSNLQFNTDGLPRFNSGGDGGVGLMQLTNANRNDRDFWNWKSNIDDGFALLAGDLTQAKNHFAVSAKTPVNNMLAALKAQYHVTSIVFETPTVNQLMQDAVSLFGPTYSSRFTRYYHEYVDANGTPTITVAGTVGTVKLIAIPSVYVSAILGG